MLKQTLKSDIIKHMKNKDKIKLTALRTLMSDIQNKEKDLKRDLSDIEIISLIEKTIKQLNETLGYAEQANKSEKISEIKISIDMFANYMPTQLTDDEAKAFVSEVIIKNGFKDKSDMGKLMKVVIPKLKGRYDSKKVNLLVNKLLQ